MAEELELELSYGDDVADVEEYGEEVDYGESEGEEAPAPAPQANEDNGPAEAKGDADRPSTRPERKVICIPIPRYATRHLHLSSTS